MENFEFCNPTKILFGKGVNSSIAGKIKEAGFKKVALISGSGSIKKNGVYQEVTDGLNQAGIEFVECWGVRPNPTLEKAEEILTTVKDCKVEALLPVGGGSVIDTAKAVAAGYYADSIWSVYESSDEVVEALPIFSVLTLSATGTEMDEFSVLSNDKELKKWGIYGRALFPIASAVDPSVQMSLPWKQTVNGVVDAFSHLMEQYFSGKNARVTMSLCESLMSTLIDCGDRLQENSSCYESRADLAWAASLALNGLARCGTGTGDWATHGIEHALSALNTSIAHGEGLAVIFPAWISYVGSDEAEAFQRWSRFVWGSQSLTDAVDAYREKLRKWGHPTTLSELGFIEEDIPKIIEIIRKAGEIGRIKVLTDDDLTEVLKLAF